MLVRYNTKGRNFQKKTNLKNDKDVISKDVKKDNLRFFSVSVNIYVLFM